MLYNICSVGCISNIVGVLQAHGSSVMAEMSDKKVLSDNVKGLEIYVLSLSSLSWYLWKLDSTGFVLAFRLLRTIFKFFNRQSFYAFETPKFVFADHLEKKA